MTPAAEKNLVPETTHEGPSSEVDSLRSPWLDSYSSGPSTDGFIALLEAFRATGGTAPGAMVARLLEEHQGGHAVSLAKRVFTRELFGFDWRANFWIPMFQFCTQDLAVKLAPQQVRAALPAQWSGWTLACWFGAPNIQLDGCSPVDALDVEFEAVLHAAESCERSEAADLAALTSARAPFWDGPPVWRERRATARL